jgi:hypothetical protein
MIISTVYSIDCEASSRRLSPFHMWKLNSRSVRKTPYLRLKRPTANFGTGKLVCGTEKVYCFWAALNVRVVWAPIKECFASTGPSSVDFTQAVCQSLVLVAKRILTKITRSRFPQVRCTRKLQLRNTTQVDVCSVPAQVEVDSCRAPKCMAVRVVSVMALCVHSIGRIHRMMLLGCKMRSCFSHSPSQYSVTSVELTRKSIPGTFPDETSDETAFLCPLLKCATVPIPGSRRPGHERNILANRPTL